MDDQHFYDEWSRENMLQTPEPQLDQNTPVEREMNEPENEIWGLEFLNQLGIPDEDNNQKVQPMEEAIPNCDTVPPKGVTTVKNQDPLPLKIGFKPADRTKSTRYYSEGDFYKVRASTMGRYICSIIKFRAVEI